MTNANSFTIGRLAKAAGVGVETIRFYQRSGLIQEPAKPVSGFRRYEQKDLDQLRFITRAKDLGFSLSEISRLISLQPNELQARQQLARQKLMLIERRISELETLATSLRQVLALCETAEHQCHCPLNQAGEPET